MLTFAIAVTLAMAGPTPAVCLDSSCPTSPLQPMAVEHRGHCEKDGIRWRTEIALASDTVHNGESYRIALATPLAADALQLGGQQALVAPVFDDGHRIVALVVAGEAIAPLRVHRGRAISALQLQSEQPTPCRTGRATLQPPWVVTPAVQKLTLDDTGDLQFEPGAAHGIERHVPFWLAASLTEAMREQADDALANHGLPQFDQPIYAVADASIVAAGGLAGEFVSVAAHRQLVAIGATAGSALIAIGLVWFYRRCANQAQRDQQRAKVDAELKRIDDELLQLDRTLTAVADADLAKNR